MDEKEVSRIAALSRIDLDETSREAMKKDLASIIDYIEVLSGVPTDSVEPLFQVSGLLNRTRADEHRNNFPMDANLKELLVDQAPSNEGSYIKVKSVLKK